MYRVLRHKYEVIMNYENIGLNEQLQPKNSPVTQQMTLVTAKEMDDRYELPAGGVNYTNIVASARAYTAVVSNSGEQGTFKDIQLAINYVRTLGGGTVFIKSGTYVPGSSITLSDTVDVYGENYIDTIIDFNQTAHQFIISGASNLRISNFRIKNCRSTTGAVYITSSGFVTLQRIYFQNNSNASGDHVDIYLGSGATPIFVEQCVSAYAGTFAYILSGSALNTFTNNQIYNSIKYAFDGVVTGSIINNKITDFTEGGIRGVFGAAIISHNYITSASSPEHAVECSATSNTTTISNNYISANSTSDTMLLTQSRTISVTGNFIQCESSNINAIKLTGGSLDNQFVGNSVFRNGTGKAILLDTASEVTNVVVGNKLNGGSTDNGVGNVVANNVT